MVFLCLVILVLQTLEFSDQYYTPYWIWKAKSYPKISTKSSDIPDVYIGPYDHLLILIHTRLML